MDFEREKMEYEYKNIPRWRHSARNVVFHLYRLLEGYSSLHSIYYNHFGEISPKIIDLDASGI